MKNDLSADVSSNEPLLKRARMAVVLDQAGAGKSLAAYEIAQLIQREHGLREQSHGPALSDDEKQQRIHRLQQRLEEKLNSLMEHQR